MLRSHRGVSRQRNADTEVNGKSPPWAPICRVPQVFSVVEGVQQREVNGTPWLVA